MKRISIVNGPYDIERLDYEIDRGFLITPNIAMFAADGKLYITHVQSTQIENVFISEGNQIVLGETVRGDVVVSEVYKLLTNMTAFDFIVHYLLTSQYDIEFNLAK